MPITLQGREDGRTTDHSDVIHVMRRYVNDRQMSGGYARQVRRVNAARELLELHDATILSLDHLPACAELVNDALETVGCRQFLHNGR